MAQIYERDIQKGISDYLKYKRFIVFKHRSVGIYKKDTSRYIPLSDGEKGISDLIACDPVGRFWAIEVKKPGGRPSPEQREFLAKVRDSDGVGLLVYSIDEVMAYVESYLAHIPATGTKPPVQDAPARPSKSKTSSKTSNRI